MDAKKAREAAYLAEVAQLYPQFPPGEVRSDEAPDFLVVSNTSVVGIEVTGFIRGQGAEGGSAQRAVEMQQQAVLRRAQAIYENSTSAWVMVHAWWRSQEKLHGRQIASLSAELARVVRAAVPSGLFESVTLQWQELRGTVLEEPLHSVTVTTVRNQRQALWAPPWGGFISFDPAGVQAAIDGKATKVDAYRRRCDEVWLLVVADDWHLSSAIDLDDDELETAAARPFSSAFDRVLLYGRANRRVLRLNTGRD